jgi:hypothetical protein
MGFTITLIFLTKLQKSESKLQAKLFSFLDPQQPQSSSQPGMVDDAQIISTAPKPERQIACVAPLGYDRSLSCLL